MTIQTSLKRRKTDANSWNWRWGQLTFFPSLVAILTTYWLGLIWFLELLEKMNFARLAKDDNLITEIYLKQLFCLGVLGGAMHCSIYIAKEFNLYHSKKDLSTAPMLFDFLGYIIQIIGAGLTGMLLLFALKTGLVVVTTGSTDIIKNIPASHIPYSEWFIAFAGGMGTHHVKAFLDKFLKKSTGTAGKLGGGHDDK
ncbi:hypothetical protein [Paraglaciecola arctica]|uniref:Uncharacterized protein n=1 Tax=Paraglaciecola arctica BSs20135 TaxID=493475 RepID=K6YHP0_9ALTE|nr:hypothetical protein [Paraglaciecola arctica]GAC17692.1 hypothetical protein GARC_0711 [Paraglaciecola arctica BSs20135]